MAITSTEERTANRLGDLERRLDALISQDRPGSQLFTANHIPFGGANGALISAANLRFVNATGSAARTGDTGAELIVESNGTGGVRYSGLRFRSVDTGVTVRSSGRILSSFLAGFFPDASLIFQTVSGAETFQDVMTMRGINVGIGTDAPSATLHVLRGTATNGSALIHGTTHGCYFHFSTDENIYLRAGKSGANIIMNDTHSGSVGVGIAPAARLDVVDGYIRARNGANVAPSSGAGVELAATGGAGYVQMYSRDSSVFQALNISGQPLIINSQGYQVGIGGTPTRKLSLITTANDYIGFGTSAAEKFVFGIEGANGGSPYLTWYDSTAGQHRMRLSSSANLHLQNAIYIGSVSTIPSYQVHVSTDSAGKPSSNVWTVTSDDITKATKKLFDHGLEALRAFPKPIEFTYNGKYNTPKDGIPGVGYSAQDVLPIAPKMVRVVKARIDDDTDREDDIMGVNTGAMQAMMHLAILELDQRLDKLEKKESNANGKN